MQFLKIALRVVTTVVNTSTKIFRTELTQRQFRLHYFQSCNLLLLLLLVVVVVLLMLGLLFLLLLVLLLWRILPSFIKDRGIRHKFVNDHDDEKSKDVPRQAEVALGVQGRFRPRIIWTFGTARVVGRQPYAPAAFTPGENPGTHFQRLSRPQGTWFWLWWWICHKKRGIFWVGKRQSASEKGICLLNSFNYEMIELLKKFKVDV